MALPSSLFVVVLAGALSALLGGYWDDAWHTERGRDSFLIAPHIAIYAGVTLAGGGLTLWLLLAVDRVGPERAVAHAPLRLALLAVAATLLSAPIDNVWHVAFGRDAVLWSPPHVLGVVGIAALMVAVLADARSPLRRSVAGGGVVTAFGFLLVEYDTDVPQFGAELWLPVLTLAGGVGLALVRRADPAPWAATRAAAVHLAAVALAAVFLLGAGFDAPLLPVLLAPAAALDLAAARGWGRASQAMTFAVAVHVTYVPATTWLSDGVGFAASDLLPSLALSALAALAAVRPVLPGAARAPGPALAVGLVTLAAAIVTTPAEAHDPGQGEEVGTVALRMAVDAAGELRVAGRVAEGCGTLRPTGLVARRGGVEVRGPVAARGCAFSGRLTLPERGRWFVYAELRDRAGGAVESWLPVRRPGRAADPARYAYRVEAGTTSAAQVAGGAVLYAAAAALLVAMTRLSGRSAAGSPRARRAGTSAACPGSGTGPG